MTDDKYGSNDSNWFKSRWQIKFSNNTGSDNKWSCTVFSDWKGNHTGNPDRDEIAKNPIDNNRYLTGGISGNALIHYDSSEATKELNIGNKYGITNVGFSSSCQYHGSQRISFDHLGRPLRGSPSGFIAPYQSNRLITSPCDINISRDSDSVIIRIEPETGYTHIV